MDREAYKVARAALIDIEAKRAAIRAPFEAQMAAALLPTDEAYELAVQELDRISDGLEIMGACEACGELIFDEDPHGSLGEGLYTCAAHAPTMSSIIGDWECAARSDPDAWEGVFESREDFAAWLDGAKADVATNGDRQVIYGLSKGGAAHG